MKHVLTPLTAAILAACTTSTPPPFDDDGNPRTRPEADQCDADGVQYHVGHSATAEMGQTMLADSGARILRWVPPRTAVTMDFRPDRLTVSYDDDMTITRVTCG
ncbi:I78 family peptidase inhibitor [Aurantiacibacter aquimixticola]|uniref:Peptidase inhibitor I78 n=1 Tax=Aurantiacibacter aquimixticola TaxID=1958945 RepID=A0A419RVU2_9SPHN|nr:I78 family peptidase inhibitor [Aurantiacibacter aquimixticola]RJY09915.1 hypothetical protein D6201_11655 [Aurantiacibacter aquimixticola]